MNRIARFAAANSWPLFFAVLSAAAFPLSGVSVSFLAQELVFRFSRYFLLALALLPPALSGAGLNFSMVQGLAAGEAAISFVPYLHVRGPEGVFVSMLLSVPPAALFGFLGWRADRKAGGDGPLVSIVLAVFASLLSGVLAGTRYTGAGDPVSASGIAHGLDGLLVLRVGSFDIPGAGLLLAAGSAFLTFFFFERRTRSPSYPAIPRRRRLAAFVASSVVAGLGMIVHLQGLGSASHGGHGQIALVSAAAFVAGGAFRADRNVIRVSAGVILFHSFYVLAPMASKAAFDSAMLGEHFRFFVACLAVSAALVRG